MVEEEEEEEEGDLGDISSAVVVSGCKIRAEAAAS